MSDAQIWYALIAGSILVFVALMTVATFAPPKPPKPSKAAPYNPSMRDR